MPYDIHSMIQCGHQWGAGRHQEHPAPAGRDRNRPAGAGANRAGTGQAGTGQAGANRAGTGQAGANRAGNGQAGIGHAGIGHREGNVAMSNDDLLERVRDTTGLANFIVDMAYGWLDPRVRGTAAAH